MKRFATLVLALWRRLPTAVRAPVHRLLHRLRRFASRAVVTIRSPQSRRAGADPLVVAGFLTDPLGIGRGARIFGQALAPTAGAIHGIDVGPMLNRAVRLEWPSELASAPRGGGTVISHINPPELMIWIERTVAAQIAGRRHIGYWAWETARCPDDWKPAMAWVDAVWTPSSFTTRAVRELLPNKPVSTVLLPVFAMPEAAPDRARLGWRDDECVVFTAFDAKSTYIRKNPMGALDAYVRAVPEPGEKARFVCKISNGDFAPTETRELVRRLSERPDTLLLDATLSDDDMTALIASTDVVLSLHRAEGFGLLVAQGMWLGKPTVTTGYSGVEDFTTAQASSLVPYKIRALSDPQGIYPLTEWAEPDMDVAAQALSELITAPTLRREQGARARAHALDVFDAARWRSEVMRLLCE